MHDFMLFLAVRQFQIFFLVPVDVNDAGLHSQPHEGFLAGVVDGVLNSSARRRPETASAILQ
jgi:hypothetical protein